jgi:CubicO group peptidase (beta-lactamase class C family)
MTEALHAAQGPEGGARDDAEVQGTCDARFTAVRDTLAAQLRSGDDVGASIAVYWHGEPVVDIWGGWADEERTRPWERDTITNVWSTTKTMTFLVALMLHDRGRLDFHAPVVQYWPEFAQGGKERVEVRHVMGHTAGLPGWEGPLQPEDLADWEKCTSALAAQAPWWTPGDGSGYHAVTQGYLIGEIVRRITGESIGSWFAREVAEPLGADFHIGLPASEDARVSNVIPPPPINPADFEGQVSDVMLKTFLNPPIDASMAHHEWWRRAEIPAANGQGNARSVAAVQSVIAGRGEARGVRLLSAQGTDPVFEVQADGVDRVLGVQQRIGMGYGLSNPPEMPLGPRACYWGGYGGSVIVMDQDAELTICYVMNRMESGLVGDLRGANVLLATLASLPS